MRVPLRLIEVADEIKRGICRIDTHISYAFETFDESFNPILHKEGEYSPRKSILSVKEYKRHKHSCQTYIELSRKT